MEGPGGSASPEGGRDAASHVEPDVVASYSLLNDETRPSVVAFDEAFVRRVHDAAGLRIKDVRRGSWWNGLAHDQDVVTAVAI